MGLNLVHKRKANLRLSLQIWDATDGRMVWERTAEDSKTKRSLIRDQTIKMEDLVKSAAEQLVSQLPGV
jgi:hypothetical protein